MEFPQDRHQMADLSMVIAWIVLPSRPPSSARQIRSRDEIYSRHPSFSAEFFLSLVVDWRYFRGPSGESIGDKKISSTPYN